MQKKIVVVLVCVLILIFSFAIYKKNNNKKNIEKVYLSDKFYNEGNYIKVKSTDIRSLNDDTYIVYMHNNFCSFSVPCEDIFKECMQKYKIDFLNITFEEFKKTDFYKTVKYAPSVIIISKGKIIDYLKTDIDDDVDKYQDSAKFEEWLEKYVYLKKEK